MAVCPLGSAADRHGQTPNGSSSIGTEVPKPLHRSRLPAPRLGGDEPGRPPVEGRPDPRAEAEVGKLVARLQDGGAKPAGKAANGVVASPALRTSTLQARRPAPRLGIYGREGERAPGAVGHVGSQLKRGRRSAVLPGRAGGTARAGGGLLALSPLDVAQQEGLGDQNSVRCGHGPAAQECDTALAS